MRKLVIGIAVFFFLASASYAQLRTIPANAKRANTGQSKAMPYVELSGKTAKFAPGAVIYDQNNRSLVQGALPPGVEVAYTTDMHGDIARVYVLTASEKATFVPKK